MSDHLVTPAEISQANAEDRVHEMLALAARLRETTGGELDDTAIAAVAEATGAPVEYVRLAVRTLPELDKKHTLWDRMRAGFLSFNPDVRRMVFGGLMGVAGGLALFLAAALRDKSGFLAMLSLITVGVGVWNSANARSQRTAVVSGAVQGAAQTLLYTLFAFVYQPLVPLLVMWHIAATKVGSMPPIVLPLFVAIGGVIGLLAHELVSKNRQTLGLHDPTEERKKLIQQLVEIQDKLNSDEQFVTFLSVDVVGSTAMKTESNALAVEYTFNEYHRYVENVTTKYGGKIHSTAGDGVTCVFDNAAGGLAAAKAILGGLFEFNAFRNRVGKDIQLRAGLHTGPVLAPGRDATSVNFSHVIDVAAHMQKAAPIGGLLVSAETAKGCPGGLAAIGEDRAHVQGIEAVTWKPALRNVPVIPTASTN